MKIQSYQLRSYVKTKFNFTEQELFDLQPGKRKVILDSVFEKFAGHRLFRDGLTNTKRMKDRFDNYRSYSHLKTFEMLSDDLNMTKQKSKNKIEQWKRKIHLAKKDRFEVRKKRKVRELSKQEYEQKWSPKNVKTKTRLERLRKLKAKEQDKEYER